MKKSILIAGLSLAALSFVSCQKEEVRSESSVSEPNFTLFAQTADTKTSNEGLNTKWVAEDAINVFHAVKDATTYTSDGKFTVSDVGTGKFAGTVSGTLSEELYDWYALYPYNAQITTPKNTTSGYVTVGGITQTQKGNDSKAHLCGTVCPLYGIAKGVSASESPAITMNQLTSVVKVKVTNNSGDNLTVNSVVFTGTEDIAGTYYIDFVSSPVVYTVTEEYYVSSAAALNVSNGAAIANDSSAEFYIAIKPFTAASGKKLKLSVNGYEKTITLTDDIDFTAGHIKTLNFSYDKTIVDCVTIPWTEDFSGTLDTNIYTLVNGGSTTKIYEANTAGGTSPELLVAKNNGSFSATVKADATAKYYLLTFKTNHSDYVTIGSETEGVVIKKEDDTVYQISVSDAVNKFKLSFCNATTNNYRLDDISLVIDNRTALAAPQNVMASLNEDDASVTNSIDVVWDAVENAESYVVTATPDSGAAVEKEVTETSCTFTGLLYETEYTITVYAKPADAVKMAVSLVSSADEEVTTGAPGSLLTTELTNANIVAAGTAATGYNVWTFMDDNKYTYKAKCVKNTHSSKTSSYHYIQIKKGTDYYIELPDLPGNIVSIEMTVSGSNKAMDAGDNSASLSLYDSSTSTTAIVSATGASTITLTVPDGTSITKGYIGASAAIRIWNIKLSYKAK